MEIKKIYSLGLARELLKKGHRIIDIELSQDKTKQIYIFKGCQQLEKDFGEIKEQRAKEV